MFPYHVHHTGVYRAAPIRAAPRANRRELKAIYKTHIDIVHIRREEHGRLFTVFGDGGKEQTPSSGSQQGSQGTAGERCTQEGDGEEGLQIMDNSLQQQVRAKEQALKVLCLCVGADCVGIPTSAWKTHQHGMGAIHTSHYLIGIGKGSSDLRKAGGIVGSQYLANGRCEKGCLVSVVWWREQGTSIWRQDNVCIYVFHPASMT